MLEAAILLIFPPCMLYAAISDAVSMTISNWVSVILVVSFALIAPFTGMDWASYGWHFLAFATVLVVTFIMFAAGGVGGGDAKLMAATALWIGFNYNLLNYLVVSTFVGGLLAIVIVTYRKSPLANLTARTALLRHLSDSSAGIPYALALATGGLTAFAGSPLGAWALARISSH
jgi:prepilin peptidase CpaA